MTVNRAPFRHIAPDRLEIALPHDTARPQVYAAAVTAIRAFFRDRPSLAALLIAAALALRVLVPGGYMPSVERGQIVVKVCTGLPDGPGTMTLAVPGLDHGQPPADIAHGKCAYADLAQAVMGGADPVVLAAMLAFVMALALTLAIPVAPLAAARLRPPLRGPPARA